MYTLLITPFNAVETHIRPRHPDRTNPRSESRPSGDVGWGEEVREGEGEGEGEEEVAYFSIFLSFVSFRLGIIALETSC